MIEYISSHWVEIFGVISGLLFIYFEIKASIWLWPISIISAAAYIIIFYTSKFYADMGLQVYFLIVGIYGWIHWLRGKSNNQKEELPIANTTRNHVLILSVITVVLFFLIKYILSEFTDSPLPGWDSFTTSLSITGTWMLARKIIEQWWVWVVVNFVSLSLYIYKGLYPTAFLYFVYGIMAIYGYFEWRKLQRNQLIR